MSSLRSLGGPQGPRSRCRHSLAPIGLNLRGCLGLNLRGGLGLKLRGGPFVYKNQEGSRMDSPLVFYCFMGCL